MSAGGGIRRLRWRRRSDIALLNNGGAARLLRNDFEQAGNWLRVVLRADAPPGRGSGEAGPLSSSFALGALCGSRRVCHTDAAGRQLVVLPEPVSPGGGSLRSGRRGDARATGDHLAAWRGADVHGAPGQRNHPGSNRVGPRNYLSDGAPSATATGSWRSGRSFARPPGSASGRGVRRRWTLTRRRCGSIPEHGDTLYYLGQCRRDVGQNRAAAEALTRLLAVETESARGHVAIASLLAAGGPEQAPDLVTAARHLESALRLNWEATGPLVLLGEIRLVQGDHAEARRLFSDALSTNPKCVEAAFLLGYLAWDAGDRPAAREHYRAALEAGARTAPVAGVLGEGDRREEAGSAPGQSLEKTLLGSYSRGLQDAVNVEPDAAGLAALYAPVHAFIARFGSANADGAGARP